ncbi:MAG TPA: hypothetical protein VLN26_08120 [Gaiellaceae bacterium]|nr:hypothetical protein [Gaiellaceae bacterium]
MERGDRERPEFELPRTDTDEVRAARVRATRRDQADGPVVETPQRELEHRGRRRVEPLRVVDRNQHRAPRRELAKHRQERCSDKPASGRTARVGAEKSDVECLRLRRRQRPENIGVDGDQEIGQAREREPGLRCGGPRRQHRKAQLAPAPHRSLPYRRLADPGLADELERCKASLVSSQEALDHGNLGLSPDEAGHSPSLQSCRGSRWSLQREAESRRARSYPSHARDSSRSMLAAAGKSGKN